MAFEEKTLKTEYLYNGKIINLKKEEVMLPNGKTAFRELVEHSGGSAILCEKDGKILLVRQFRAPYKKEILEIPAGKVNPGEDPEETAIRELEEEGGVKAEKVEKMFDVYPSPGYTEEIIRIYRAINVSDSKMNLDDDEFLDGNWYDKETLKTMIKNGEIKDGKTLIALLAVL